ncbi:hypothetical protein D3C87_951590 [compost metagenome]
MDIIAPQEINTFTAKQRVVITAANELIITVPTIEKILPVELNSNDRLVAVSSQTVIAFAAKKQVVSAAAIQGVVTFTAIEKIIPMK